jgi:addiction module RelB/DinJ family antitoxin
MASTSITFRLDEQVKAKAETVIQQMGITTTSVLNALMVSIAREGKLPFELVGDDYAYRQMLRRELEESLREAADPNVVEYDFFEVMGEIRKKYGL